MRYRYLIGLAVCLLMIGVMITGCGGSGEDSEAVQETQTEVATENAASDAEAAEDPTEESAEADSAEIWRKGWKRVRRSELMEKKSVRLAKEVRSFWIKTPQPFEYHQTNISVITIIIL